MGAIYLDYNASTPIASVVADAMRPFLVDHYGNPSSGHWASKSAKAAFEVARSQVAGLINAPAEDVIFTSGGSESNNHAIKGAFFHALRASQASAAGAAIKAPHFIISAVEHASVSQPCEYLTDFGAELTVIGVDSYGRVSAAAVAEALRDNTVLVSVMHANNEVGTVQPIAEIGALLSSHCTLFHCDAAQAAGKIDIDVQAMGVDLLSIAGHKLYAAKGIGALYIRAGSAVDPLVHGAGHEAGRRSGTENVVLAVGLGAAAELAQSDPCGADLLVKRDDLWARLSKAFGDKVVLNGHPTERLPNTLNVGFVGKYAADILANMTDLAASIGAACHAGSRKISGVLSQMGVPLEVGLGSIRFSLGRNTDEQQLEALVEKLRKVV